MPETAWRGNSEEILKLEQIRNELFQAEESARHINDMNNEDAHTARKRLTDARWELSHYLLNLPGRLSALGVRDRTVRHLIPQVTALCRYPCVTSANSILAVLKELTSTDVRSRSPQDQSGDHATSTSESFAENLRAAILANRDSQSSAAGKMNIATKTLKRLLDGKNTKPTKQDAAQHYIDDTRRKRSK